MAVVEHRDVSPPAPPTGSSLLTVAALGDDPGADGNRPAASRREPGGVCADTLLREWRPLFRRLPIGMAELHGLVERAVENRTGFLSELLASGRVEEADVFRALADELDLPFLARVDPAQLLVRERHRLAALASRHGLPLALVQGRDGGHDYVLARADISLADMRARLARWPGLAARLSIAPPSALRAAIVARTRDKLLFDARYDIFARAPAFSARYVVNGWQGMCVGVFMVAFPLCVVLSPAATMLAVQTVASVAFLSCVILRVAALRSSRPLRLRHPRPFDPAAQPVYSVLVALYKEREIIPQLLVALGRLQWPRSKLEIKLVCEADDHETLSALRAYRLRPGVEIVEVPSGLPRTKPKALAYALPLCSGEFVTLYDAEDRPHPDQLVAAWQRFRDEGDDLACLQAPLVVTNGKASWLSFMFAFEYAGLFRGLLPMLARGGLLLPLGGTSNHFRRAALLQVGGWDAYNVTEDADLGLRLKRFGYRTGTIEHPTFEDGPDDLRAWLPQRVRWFKGWMQTWLVHMRDPARLWLELGPLSFLIAQILFAGMLVSALVHPVFLASILYVAAKLAWAGAISQGDAVLAALGLANIAVGYGAFVALGWTTLSPPEKLSLGRIIVLTPLHWLLLSVAAWIALWEIYRRPHHWHKTPHRQARLFARPVAAFGSPAIAAPTKARR